MRVLSAIVVSAVVALVSAQTAAHADAAVSSKNPRGIMETVFERAAGQRRSSRLKMQISDDAGSRKRGLVMRSVRSTEARKSLIIIDSPADVRGSGFLSVDYSDRSKDDERWLYLPGLHRTTRIASGQLSKAFLGSDFSFADLAPPDPSLFDFTMKDAAVDVDGETCWHILATPKSGDTKRSIGYSKSEFWVSKGKLAFVRVRVQLLDGKTKYIKASDFRKVKGGWVANKVVARTVQRGKLVSETQLQVTSLNDDDATVTDADFTKQRLERGL